VADHQAVAGLERVHFPYNQFTLDEPARVTLEQNGRISAQQPDAQGVVEGIVTSAVPTSTIWRSASAGRSGQELSGLARIAGDRLTAISYGEEQPLVAASNEEAWAKNAGPNSRSPVRA